MTRRGRPRLPDDELFRRGATRYLRNRDKLIRYASDALKALRPRVADAFALLRAIDKDARLRDRARTFYKGKARVPAHVQFQNGQDYAKAVKEYRPCLDCGQKFPACCMDFDHVRGAKVKDVSSCNSLAAVKAEITKCDLVCANCHRLRTLLRSRLPLLTA